jgi:mercuric ion transport protein
VTVETEKSAPNRTGSGALLIGGLAAIVASTCCLGPLVLVVLGVSGAWIANLTKLEPYRLYFIGGAVIALFFAGRQIFRPVKACEPGQVCAVPQTRRVYKILFGLVSVFVFIALVYPYLVRFLY